MNFKPNFLQVSRDPLPTEDMLEIFEEVKDMGVLIGKGGLYGQVPQHTTHTYVTRSKTLTPKPVSVSRPIPSSITPNHVHAACTLLQLFITNQPMLVSAAVQCLMGNVFT